MDLFDEIETSPKTQDVFAGDLFDELTQKEPSPTWEALKKTAAVLPAQAAMTGREFLKGATLGAVDIPTPTAEAYLKEREALPVHPYVKTAAHLLGEFLPIGALAKIISPIVKGVMAGAGMVRTAATEAALTGVTYEAVKGAAQGKDPVEILKEMGYAGPQWVALGAAAGKLGAVLSRAKKAKPEDVAADLKRAQEEIESTIAYTPGKAEPRFEYAPEWQPPTEGEAIPFRRYPKQELTLQPSAETPMRIGPRPPEAGLEVPTMREALGAAPEQKLLAPPPDWIPGKPVTVRRPSLETPPNAAEFKGPEKVFVESEKGPVEVKWNAEKKVYEPIPDLSPKTGIFDPNNPPKAQEANISAVKLDDGTIYYDKEAKIHADLITRLNISPERVVEGGFIVNGKYVQGGVDAARIGKQARAKIEVEIKRAEKVSPAPSGELSEPAKRALIRIEGKTVNGLAQDILSETPAKQNAAIEAVKKAVEEGKITQDEALHHINNEMMNVATEKIQAGANLTVTLDAAQRAGMTFTERITKEVRPQGRSILAKLTGEEPVKEGVGIPDFLKTQIERYRIYKGKGISLTQEEGKLFDKWLVDTKNPLAYEAGTTEGRFKKFAESKGESGKVDLDLLRHITISGLGAATGATIDEENRWRGAIIGGATGFAISRGLLRKVLGERAVSRIPETKAKIELPPIKEGPITQPVLRLDINKNIANVTEELFKAAQMKWDPELLITDQIATALKTVPVGTFNQILGNVGVPIEEFTKYYFRQSISKYAKGLGEWGAVVRRLMKDNPEAQKALDDISRAASDMDAMASAGDWWKRVDNIRRGLLVTQLATAMRNAETQVGRVGLDVFEQALDAGLQRLFKRKVTTNPLDGLESLMTLFRRGKKADVEKILNARDPNGNPLFEGEFNRLFLTYSSDIMRGRAEGIPEKIVDTLNVANRFQEYAVRRTVFLSKLDQRMRGINQDLGKIIEKNEIGKISEDDIKYAVNSALEYTWARSPKYGSIAQGFISFINRLPGATFVIPFPRFLTNAIKFQFDYSPLGMLKLLSPSERVALKAGDTKTISRAILGTAMLGTAYQIRNSEYAGEKWYELNVGGRPVDTRAYNPFASYLFVADIIKKSREGSLYKLTSSDIVQGLLSTNLRAGAGLYSVDQVLNIFSDESKVEKGLNVLKQFGGEVAAGFLMPVRQVRDFLYGFDDMVLKESRGEPFWGPIKAGLPIIEKGMEPRYKPTRAEPQKWTAPAIRQVTGISVGEPKNAMEKELDRLGFERREILPSVGDAKADNLIAQKMGSIVEEIGLPIVEDPSYLNMPDAEKGYFLSKMIEKLRTAAKKEAQGENPELFEKIKRTPRRKEIFLKSLEER